MSFNGSGVFVVNSTGQPVVASTLIEASVFNAFSADVATGLSTCITKDGQTTITANIPFGGNKITGLGAGTARTDAASIATIQDGTGVYVGTVGGTADVITLTPSPAITAYAAGQTFRFIASGANTTNVTVNVSALGAKAITKNGTTALVAGDIPSGATVEITYDGTRFQLGTVGAATYSTLPVVDTTAIVKGSSDPTKLLRFEVDGLTTGTTRVATWPDADLTVVGETTTQTLTNKTLTSPVLNTGVSGTAIADASAMAAMTSSSLIVTPSANKIILSTEQATTSGTTKDFTGIPSGVRLIRIMFKRVSTNGTSNFLIQLGDSGGIENSGYLASAQSGGTATSSTSGFILTQTVAAAGSYSGVVELVLENSSAFSWIARGQIGRVDASVDSQISTGDKDLSAELTQLRITTGSGDTFDAGAINIQYER